MKLIVVVDIFPFSKFNDDFQRGDVETTGTICCYSPPSTHIAFLYKGGEIDCCIHIEMIVELTVNLLHCVTNHYTEINKIYNT